ncbi:MAG: hypothetical protein H0X38_09960 [Planctomycetes bacterium]|nr:hypothetical protein [Planctomycetota bacterium]
MTSAQLDHLLIVAAILLGVIAVAATLWWWLRQRLGLGAGGERAGVARVLGVQGASRCVEALTLLRTLDQRGDGDALAKAWHAIEIPLLQALPDCPPPLKTALRRTLEDCAGRCPRRDAARAMMTMRDALHA